MPNWKKWQQSPPEPTVAAPATDLSSAPFAIVGLGNTENRIHRESLRALDVVTINADTQKRPQDFEESCGLKLFDLVGLKANATKVVITASDGFSAEVSRADIKTSPNAMVSFTNTAGQIKMVMPDWPSTTWG